jgi:hypothetical protein
VQTKCQTFDWNEARDSLHENDTKNMPYWSVEGFECLGDTTCNRWKEAGQSDRLIDSQYWDHDPTEQLYPLFRWINVGDGPLSAAVKLPYIVYELDDPVTDETAPSAQGWWFSVCTFVPHWVSSSVSLPIRRTNVVESNTSFINSNMKLTQLPDYTDSNMIQIDHEFAELINFPVNDTWAARVNARDWNSDDIVPLSVGAVDSLLSSMINYDGANVSFWRNIFQYRQDSTHVFSEVEKVLGLDLVNAISMTTAKSADPYLIKEKTADSITILYPSGINPSSFDPTTLTRGNGSCPVISTSEDNGAFCLLGYDSIDQVLAEFEAEDVWTFTLDQFGFGAGMPSPTLTFAMFILYFYLAMVFSFFLGLFLFWIFIFKMSAFRDGGRQPVCVAGWDDLQDLLALAWKSKCPDGLVNTGAGVKSFSDVWKKHAIVRVTAGDNLELVIQDADQAHRVQHGVYYG